MNVLHTLPKVELHLHLDCSLSYQVVKRIDPAVTEREYSSDYVAPSKCTDLSDFLTRAPKGIALMQTTDNIQMVMHDLFKQMLVDNMLYAEIRFAPLQHLEKGLTSHQVVAAAEEAMSVAVKRTGIEARLILCTLRHFSKEQSMETVKLTEQFRDTYLAGFDIAANEAGFPIDNHIEAFDYAREKSIFCTAHAGEAKGPESVWEALEYFGPSRIGHGVRSIEDKHLVEHLCKNKIHLEVCPGCNVQIDIYDSYDHHPIDQLYKADVSLSVNTDTRTITDINLNTEYKKLSQTFGWTINDFYNCNVNALNAAFIPEALKKELISKLRSGYNKPEK
jgi:adenosine deaminase